MAEQHIQDFADGVVLAPGDLMHIQRQDSGVWNDYAMPVEWAMGTGLLPYMKVVTFDLSDFYGDTIQNLIPVDTGFSYIPLHIWMTFTPEDEGAGAHGMQVLAGSGGADVFGVMALDSSIQAVQTSPMGKNMTFTFPFTQDYFLDGYPGVWLWIPEGLGSGTGSIVVKAIYHKVPNTP